MRRCASRSNPDLNGRRDVLKSAGAGGAAAASRTIATAQPTFPQNGDEAITVKSVERSETRRRQHHMQKSKTGFASL
jgi:hypothetical protein